MDLRKSTQVNALVVVLALLLGLVVLFISFSDGSEYLHAFGKMCQFIHDGWHFHLGCVPNPSS